MASLVSAAAVDSLRPLLEFIYAGEGGYDSYNRGVAGDSPSPYPHGGLQKLSIAQVMSKQQAGELFAVGAAQFIPDTLKMAVDALGVDVTDKFTAENQDRLAVALLIGGKRPKLAAYLLGKSNDLGAAQLDLAKEWASIPGPDGRGFYDGDSAGNRATQKVKDVQAALRAGREGLAAAAKPKPAQVAVAKGETPEAPKAQALFTIEALQDTWLKKKPVQAEELEAGEKVAVPRGRAYGVVSLDEVPADGHAQVVLGGNAGEWFVFQPHWRRQHKPAAEAAPTGAVDWKDMDALVTRNLTVGEVLQWDPRRAPAARSADIRRILDTAAQYQRVRDAWGAPLGVTSFYRPEPINSEVGGVRGSQHIAGNAMDLYPVGRDLQSFYDWIRVRWSGGLGDGRNKGFIHLDRRNGGGFVPGAGARPAAEWLY
jgi:hypothetical protein